MSKLAIHGGTPVRSAMLPYGTQWIDEEDITVVSDVLRGGALTQGPWIERFEEAVAGKVNARYAVAFSSGTAALHAACAVAGLGPGDKLLTSPITFVASSNCALYVGAKPDFADIDPLTYNIDPQKLPPKWDDQLKIIVPVDFSGQPADVRQIRELRKDRNTVILQDAAHSLGAYDQGEPIGSLADMTMFSFHPVKHVTTGEGGVIVTGNESWAEQLRLFRSHGITRDPFKLTANDGPWYYEMQSLGYHYRMTDLQAALGCSQLKRLDAFVARRREIAEIYNEAFASLEGLQLPYQRPGTESAWHLYMLRLKHSCFSASRLDWFQALRAENIGVHVHYIPVYRQPYYQNLGFRAEDYPHSEQYYAEAVTLPIFPKMTDQDVNDVILAVKKAHETYLRKNK